MIVPDQNQAGITGTLDNPETMPPNMRFSIAFPLLKATSRDTWLRGGPESPDLKALWLAARLCQKDERTRTIFP